MRFFTDTKIRLGSAHNEYAQYWRNNSEQLPDIMVRLSVGMLPEEFFTETVDPVFLHDARIQSVDIAGGNLSLSLQGDDDGDRRLIEMHYDCRGFDIPKLPPTLLDDMPYCDLMCHEFHAETNSYYHQILFASGTELTVQFHSLVAEFNPDRDRAKA